MHSIKRVGKRVATFGVWKGMFTLPPPRCAHPRPAGKSEPDGQSHVHRLAGRI